MRIVVSGTHASGKSTLISDFRQVRPRYVLLGDPYDELESESDDPAGEASFAAQLHLSARRLRDTVGQRDVVAERGPLDFVAYLMALEVLGRSTGVPLPRAREIAARSLAHVELVVLVPLDERHPIRVPADEDPALRHSMNDALFELADDLAQDSPTPFLSLGGDPAMRLASLLSAVEG
jgi:hypothetical protein